MQAMRYYDFNLTAGGTQMLTVEGAYFRIQSQTGAIDVTVESVGTLPGLLTGQGLKDTPFKRLLLRDVSGSPNSGQILVASREFIDNRTYGVNSLDAATLATLRQPLASTGNFKNTGALAANTPETIFSAASNVNGAILLTAGFNTFGNAALANPVILAKATAPTSISDGEVYLAADYTNVFSTTYTDNGQIAGPQFVAAGLGLYYITAAAGSGGIRFARYRLL